MEQFKNHPRLSGLYNPKKRIVRDAAWVMAFLAAVTLALVLGAIPYYDEAKMICLIAGWVMLGALAVGSVMNSLIERRENAAHAAVDKHFRAVQEAHRRELDKARDAKLEKLVALAKK